MFHIGGDSPKISLPIDTSYFFLGVCLGLNSESDVVKAGGRPLLLVSDASASLCYCTIVDGYV